MNLKEHCERVSGLLASASEDNRQLFVALAADRLRGCVWISSFGAPLWNVFENALGSLWGALQSGHALDSGDVERILKQMDAHFPPGGEPLAAQLQSAFICLTAGLTSEIGVVINALVDALDNYRFYVDRSLTGRLDSPENYPGLTREYEYQIGLAARLSGGKALTADELKQLRVSNSEYAITPAVGW